MVLQLMKTLGLSSEARADITVAANSFGEAEFTVIDNRRCYLIHTIGISGVAGDEISIAAYHPDLAPHEIRVSEWWILNGIRFSRLVRVNEMHPLRVKITNHTAESLTIILSIEYWDVAVDQADRLDEAAKLEILQAMRRS